NLPSSTYLRIRQWTESVLLLKKDSFPTIQPVTDNRMAGEFSSPCESEAPMRDILCNPKGIASSSPRLARQRLPWITGQHGINRNAVAAIRFWFDVCVTLPTTPLGLMIFVRR